MIKLTETLIPGIVAIVFGLGFLLNRQRFIEIIKESGPFWKRITGIQMQNDLGRSGEFLVTMFTVVLGISFLVAGVVLLYRYFKA